MHTGVISFCDRVAYNIKSSDTKDVILHELEVLYNIKILQKHWHSITPANVSQIYRSPHIACLRSNGNPYYVFFSKYEDVPIIYFIDKKVQPGYQKPRIILGRGRFDPSLFETGGTVLDGEMVKDSNGQWIFLINDVLVFKGSYLHDVHMPKRLVHAYTVIKSFTPDPIMDVCTFQVKQYCYASKEGLDFLLDLSSRLPYTNRGIYYCPYMMQYKPKLYNFDESLIKDVYRKVKDTPDFREITTTPTSRSESITEELEPPPVAQICPDIPITSPRNADERLLWLKKTEHPDVYNLYESQNTMSTLGVAHIPSLSMSRRLRSVFKELTVAVGVQFSCKFNEAFQKYEPISVLT